MKKIVLRYLDNEVCRYFFSGLLVFLADFSILLVLTEVFEVNYLVSNGLSFSLGVFLSYLFCRLWVFKVRRYHRVEIELLVFIAVSLGGILVNELLLWFFVESLAIHYAWSKVGVTVLVFVLNFMAKKVTVFSKGGLSVGS